MTGGRSRRVVGLWWRYMLVSVVALALLGLARRWLGAAALPLAGLAAGGLAWALGGPARPWSRHALALGATALTVLAAEMAVIVALGAVDQRRPARVIVVLGARVHPDGTPSEALSERVATAVDLYRQGLAPTVLVSGGTGSEGHDEAAVMRRMAASMGVPDGAIVEDGAGTNTEATVEHARDWLAGHGGGQALVVSHGFHLARVRLLGSRHGLACATVPADEGETRLRGTPYYVLREALGLAFYYVRG